MSGHPSIEIGHIFWPDNASLCAKKGSIETIGSAADQAIGQKKTARHIIIQETIHSPRKAIRPILNDSFQGLGFITCLAVTKNFRELLK